MYIVIGGAGDAGRYMGRILLKEGHEIAFIDNDNLALEKAKEMDALVVKGDVCDYRSLLDAEIEESDYYLGLVRDDSANLVSCALANFYGCKTLCRIKSPSLAKDPLSRRYTYIGVDAVLCPSLICASQISRVYTFSSKLDKVNNSGIRSFHGIVQKDSFCKDKSISSLDLPDGVSIVSVFRGVEQVLPTDSFVLRSEDEFCIFLDQRVEKEKVEEKLGFELGSYSEIRNVFITGITDIGLTLARALLDSGISVSIMDSDEDKTNMASESLSSATVINADPLGHGILVKESIEKFDVLMALGENLERNIFTSILSKRFNVPNAVSLVNRIDLKESIEGTLVDSAVVPNLLLVNTIVNIIRESRSSERYLRRQFMKTRETQTKEILTAEIKVTKRVRCLDKKIMSFSPDITNFLISAVEKEGKGFIPDEEYVIKEGDKLFVFYHSGNFDTVKRWLIG